MQNKHRLISLDSLDNKYLSEYRQIVLESRADFIALIGQAKPKSLSHLDWYVTSVGTRNTYLSKLFSNFCLSVLAKRIIDRDEVDEIQCKSPALRQLVREICQQNKKGIKTRSNTLDSIFYLPRMLLNRNHQLLRSAYLMLSRWWHVSRTRTAKTDSFKEPIICIGTYVYNESFKGSIFTDRHYPGLFEDLSDRIDRVRLVPTLFGVKYSKTLLKLIRNSAIRFMLKEDYLSLGDYLTAFLHGFRVGWFLFHHKKIIFNGFNIWPLIAEELRWTCHNWVSVDGVLNYQFIKKLWKRKIQIDNYLDWFENQSHSRGTILGLNTYYQNIQSTGYIGFPLMRDYFCLYPTPAERKDGILPKRIMVIGPGFIEPLREFDKDLAVCAGPALRFKGLWRKPKAVTTIPGKPHILIALASVPATCNEILFISSGALKNHEVDISIRRHPSMTENNCRLLVSKFFQPNQYSFSQGSFDDAVEQASIFISAASSTCLEAVVKGIRTIVVESSNGLCFSPVPSGLPEQLCMTCATAEDFAIALSSMLKNDSGSNIKMREIGEKVRDSFFQRPTIEGMREMVGIS